MITSRQLKISNPSFTRLSVIATVQPKSNQRNKKIWSAIMISQQMLNITLNLVTDNGEEAMLTLIVIIHVSRNV